MTLFEIVNKNELNIFMGKYHSHFSKFSIIIIINKKRDKLQAFTNQVMRLKKQESYTDGLTECLMMHFNPITIKHILISVNAHKRQVKSFALQKFHFKMHLRKVEN